MVLEEGVGDGPEPIVLFGQHPRHHVVSARIVEAGQQDERAEPDVAVLVIGDGSRVSAGTAIGRRRAAERARRLHADRKLEIRQLVDRGADLCRR